MCLCLIMSSLTRRCIAWLSSVRRDNKPSHSRQASTAGRNKTTEADKVQGPSPAASAASMQQAAEAFTVRELQRPCPQTSVRLLNTTKIQGFISVQLEPGDEAAVQVCMFLDLW